MEPISIPPAVFHKRAGGKKSHNTKYTILMNDASPVILFSSICLASKRSAISELKEWM